jgi:hypothetical protein
MKAKEREAIKAFIKAVSEHTRYDMIDSWIGANMEKEGVDGFWFYSDDLDDLIKKHLKELL